MKLTYLFLLTALSLTFGCTREVAVNPSTATTPSPIASADKNIATIVKSGTFVAGEHDTKGEVRIFAVDGNNYLELDKAFTTSSSGPDLYIILHRSDDVLATTVPPAYPIKAADYVIIDRLQKYSGSQRYLIPKNIQLENYQSAVIWCRQFNATFGTAKLRS
jgi:Electron transfer DM13